MCEVIQKFFDSDENIYDAIQIAVPTERHEFFKFFKGDEYFDETLTLTLKEMDSRFAYMNIQSEYMWCNTHPHYIIVSDVHRDDYEAVLKAIDKLFSECF